MRIHLLDVGQKRFGDAILVVSGALRILVDGAHQGDDSAAGGFASIPDQIGKILGSPPPFDLSLLVVTHCHSDHIGCLPELVADGIIRPAIALAADPDMGYGVAQDGGDALAGLDPATRGLLAALRQEPFGADATDDEIQRFIADAVSEEPRYRRMLEDLERQGCRVVRYVGPNAETAGIEQALAATGLRIHGPSTDHLVVCTAFLARNLTDAATAVGAAQAGGRDFSSVELYRLLSGGTSSGSADEDSPLSAFLDSGERPGAAVNDQSIVISVAGTKHRGLLTGDMQFASPDVPELKPLMTELLTAIESEGPYGFVKLPHHAARNGFNSKILKIFRQTRAFGISTGRSGTDHPNRQVLELLAENSDDIRWARTDINGSIGVDLSKTDLEIEVSAGELNDATPKQRDETIAEIAPPAEEVLASVPGVTAAAEPATAPGGDRDVVIMASIPSHLAQVRITVDIEQSHAPRPSPIEVGSPIVPAATPPGDAVAWENLKLAGGRALPKLAFITDRRRLAAKIGDGAVARIANFLTARGHLVLAPGDVTARRQASGVVILGGYDVIPAVRYDVLPDTLRPQVRPGDPDNFIVWSDQIYGVTGNDELGDIPVSRIPDGGSEAFIASCLTGSAAQPLSRRHGIRNAQRPFAQHVFAGDIAGSGQLLVSAPAVASSQPVTHLAAAHVYFMLHGSEADCTKFWGEDPVRGTVEAFNVLNIENASGAIVFSGCCWGALTVRDIASRSPTSGNAVPLDPSQSIALRFLEKGARCFVGCTGAHYSPLTGNFNYFGRPMHSAFWKAIGAGMAPAPALFAAKKTYITDLHHGRTGPEDLAIEYKILRQFTCLGLGW